jgi:hypothetical protein
VKEKKKTKTEVSRAVRGTFAPTIQRRESEKATEEKPHTFTTQEFVIFSATTSTEKT